MLPKGVATFLPQAALHKRQIEEAVLDVFAKWGYQEIVPPTFEYLDVIGRGLGRELVEKGYKFVDRSSGRLLLLRPDVTPQIARIAATLMADQPKPLRLGYCANVFRHEAEHAGRAREVFQIGCELIGLEGPEGDAELIAIAIEALNRLGLKNFKVALGQVEYFRALMTELRGDSEAEERFREAVARKDQSRLERLLTEESVSPKLARALRAIMRLYGHEEVLDRAGRMILNDGCRVALERLREVYGLLRESGLGDFLVIDLADLRGFDYYTGIIFEIFAEDLGLPVGRGGRYDNLVGKFGKPCHATGFALDVEHLQLAQRRRSGYSASPPADLLMAQSKPPVDRLLSVAQSLRSGGLRVALSQTGTALADLVQNAKAVGIPTVVLLEPRRARIVDVVSGRERNGDAKRLMTLLKTPSAE